MSQKPDKSPPPPTPQKIDFFICNYLMLWSLVFAEFGKMSEMIVIVGNFDVFSF